MSYRTYSEYLRHPQFIAAREAAMLRDSYRCVDCGSSATEVHHIRYCKWGGFDTAENLISLCHGCHCERHRCGTCGEVALKAFEIKSGSKNCRDCVMKSI